MDHSHEPETKLPPAPDAKTLISGSPATATASAPGRGEIPERIGAYKVLHKIGEGGMGYVLLAMRDDGQFRQRVAIKLIKRGMDTDEVLKRFEFERQVLGALNHPNIARLYDGGATEDGRPYFVLEHVEGEPIDQYCDSQQLSIADRLALFRKVCSAVHYAHQNLIVHRDIKPGNILVTASGEPKLLDFGIAKLLRSDIAGGSVATMADVRLMTPEYASPEQVQGKPITTATDVYSLGVLLYELLTGHPPYHLRTRMRDEIERVICTVEPERPSTAISKAAEIPTDTGESRILTPEEVARFRDVTPLKARKRLSGDLDNIVLMALRKTPRRRYSSVEQFSDDIRRHGDGLPVIARPETWGYLFSKFVQRNKVPVAAAAAVFLSLTGGIAATSYMAHAADVARGREAEQRQKAELRTAQLRTICRDFLNDFYRQIERLEAGSTARAALAQASLGILRQLDAEAAQAGEPDLELRADLALGFERAGEAMRDAGEAATARGVEALVQAEAIRAALGDPVAHAGARVKLAAALLAANRAVEARGHLDAVMEEAAGRSEPAWKQLQAGALQVSAQVHRHTGKFDDAFANLNEAILLRDGIGQDRAALAEALTLRAWLSNERENFVIAMEDASRAVSIYATLPDAESGKRLAALRLAGRIHMNLGEFSLARERFDGARRIAERRYDADPLSIRAFEELARAYEEAGDMEFEAGDFATAKVVYGAYLARADEAFARDPLSFSRARAAALAREKLADAGAYLREFDQRTLDLYDDARARYDALAREGQQPERLREDHARATLSSGYVLDEMNSDEPSALERYRQAHGSLGVLRDLSGLKPSEKLRYSIGLRNAGFLALKLGVAEDGERFLTDAIRTAEPDDPKRYKVMLALGLALEARATAESAKAQAATSPAERTSAEARAAAFRDRARETGGEALRLTMAPFSQQVTEGERTMATDLLARLDAGP